MQKEILEKDVLELQKKSEAIENYYSALIERNNQEYELLASARKALIGETQEFLASDGKRKAVAEGLVVLNKTMG